jgi:hypothetical protein
LHSVLQGAVKIVSSLNARPLNTVRICRLNTSRVSCIQRWGFHHEIVFFKPSVELTEKYANFYITLILHYINFFNKECLALMSYLSDIFDKLNRVKCLALLSYLSDNYEHCGLKLPSSRSKYNWFSAFWQGGSVVGWGTMLQAGKSRVRFTIMSLNFSNYLIFPASLWPWGGLTL